MAIRIKGNGLFLHIPKTGGSWVTSVLKECGLIQSSYGHKHAGLEQVLFQERLNHEKLKGFRYYVNPFKWVKNKPAVSERPFVFCFVRDPIHWYESWWTYMCEHEWRDWGGVYDINHWHPNAILNGLGDEDFNQFIRNVIQKRPGYVSELYSIYTRPYIDFIGKTENLAQDLVKVLKFLDLDFDEEFIQTYGKVNASSLYKDKLKWDESLKTALEAIELPARIHYAYLSEAEKVKFKDVLCLQPNHSLSVPSLKT